MNLYRHNSTFKVKQPKPRTFKRSLVRKQINKVGKLKRSRMKPRRIPPAELKWAAEVRKRDDNTCQFPSCDKQGKSLDAHHIAPRSLRPDLRLDLSNGITLCNQHHVGWVHAAGNRDEAISMGLLNLETYELAQKRKAAA